MGGGRGRGDEAGLIPGFRFHSAVVAGGGTAGTRWGLWELCKDKEQAGSPAVCLTTRKYIFLFLVIPTSVDPADDLIPSFCLLLSYSEEVEDNKAWSAEMIGCFTQYTTRNVIKNSVNWLFP